MVCESNRCTYLAYEPFLMEKFNMEYTKNCPKCGKIQKYARKSGLERAIKKNSICTECRGYGPKSGPEGYSKNCPQCNKIQKYKSQRGLNKAIKNKTICSECSHKNKRINSKEKKRRKAVHSKRYNQTPKYKKYKKQYYLKPENIIKQKKQQKRYRERPEVKEKTKEYYNRPDIRIKRRDHNRKYSRERRKDPIIKMNERMSNGIRSSLQSNNLSKRGKHWEDLIGYTSQDLKKHIESLFTDGMTWEKLGKGEIQIDHIIPISFFVYISTGDVEFRMCWSLENLQPLWTKDNLEKNDKMTLWGKEVNARDIK